MVSFMMLLNIVESDVMGKFVLLNNWTDLRLTKLHIENSKFSYVILLRNKLN